PRHELEPEAAIRACLGAIEEVRVSDLAGMAVLERAREGGDPPADRVQSTHPRGPTGDLRRVELARGKLRAVVEDGVEGASRRGPGRSGRLVDHGEKRGPKVSAKSHGVRLASAGGKAAVELRIEGNDRFGSARV